MASRGLEWKVGLVVLVATVIFVGGVIYLGEKEIGRKGALVRVAFPEVGGLNQGDPVMVSGLRRGAVEGLELREQEVVVTLQLRPDVVLHSDARISVENMGIMGEKFVAVDPGAGPDPLDTSQLIVGGYSPGITEAMAQLGVVLEDIGAITARVEAILQEHEVVAPLEETIKSLRDVSRELQLMITENREEVQPAVRSFRSIVENVDELVEANKGKVDTTVTSFAASAARLDETTERMAEAVTSLELVLSRIEHGQGTLGKLSRDDKLYRELLLATQNLNDLLRDVRKNPKRYLKIEIF